MEVIEIPVEQLREAPWNANVMDAAMRKRLVASVERYGLVENLVARPLGKDRYEVLGGNQRLGVLREMGYESIPCVVVELDDAHARLLSQALNRIAGEDDLGLRAELARQVLESIGEEDVLSLLPETEDSLAALAALGQDTIGEHLEAWEKAQGARLKHFAVQLTPAQLETVEEALGLFMDQARTSNSGNPNMRGNALYLMCRACLDKEQQQ